MNPLERLDFEAFRAIDPGLRQPWLNPVVIAITYTGLGVSSVVLSLLFAVSRSTRAYVIPMLLSLLFAGFVYADGIKLFIHRPRPSYLSFANPLEDLHLNSFPSGHTSDAFSLAFMLVFLTWGTSRAAWGWLSLIWAVTVGLSRIYIGVHWPTDVLGGALCGLGGACTAHLIVTRFARRKEAST